MRFSCETCQTAYRIDDSKLAGKVLEVQCRKCSDVMVVRDASVLESKATDASVLESKATENSEAVWYAGIDAKPIGPVAVDELLRQLESGAFNRETMVWKAPMENWVPAKQVDLFKAVLARAVPKTAVPVAAVAEPAVPDPAVAEAAVPDPAVPEAAVPDPAVPEAAVPDPAVAEAAVPEAAVPDPAVAEAAVPDPAVAEAAVPEAAVADPAVAEAAVPETEILEAAVPSEVPARSLEAPLDVAGEPESLVESESPPLPDALHESDASQGGPEVQWSPLTDTDPEFLSEAVVVQVPNIPPTPQAMGAGPEGEGSASVACVETASAALQGPGGEDKGPPGGLLSDVASVPAPAPEADAGTTVPDLAVVPASPGAATGADGPNHALDAFDDFFNSAPAHLDAVDVEETSRAGGRASKEERRLLKTQLKEGKQTLVGVAALNAPSAKEQEALRKEFSLVRELEEEARKKKRLFSFLGTLTLLVIAAGVIYGQADPSSDDGPDETRAIARPDFENTGAVPQNSAPEEVQTAPGKSVEPPVAEVGIPQVKTVRKTSRPGVDPRAVQKRKAEEAARRLKRLTAAELAAETLELSGKSELMVQVTSDVEADKKRAMAEKKAREAGGMTERQKEIRRRMKGRASRLLKCRDSVEDVVGVRMTISATGRVIHLDLSKGSPQKKNCMSMDLKKLHFPEGDADITVTFKYSI